MGARASFLLGPWNCHRVGSSTMAAWILLGSGTELGQDDPPPRTTPRPEVTGTTIPTTAQEEFDQEAL